MLSTLWLIGMAIVLPELPDTLLCVTWFIGQIVTIIADLIILLIYLMEED